MSKKRVNVEYLNQLLINKEKAMISQIEETDELRKENVRMQRKIDRLYQEMADLKDRHNLC